MKKYFICIFFCAFLSLNISCLGKNDYKSDMKVYEFYVLYSMLMGGRGYDISTNDCNAVEHEVLGEYSDCKITNDVDLLLMYDANYVLTGVKVVGYQKKSGIINPDTDTAFRCAYACFYSDTSETTYQDWLSKIQYGMTIDKTYRLNGVSAIWGEGLMTGKTNRSGQYYYQILFLPE